MALDPEPAPVAVQSLTVPPEHSGDRLDRFVAAALPQLSRARVARLIEDGAVSLNGQAVKAATKVRSGDVVSVSFPPPALQQLVPNPLPVPVVYEDEDVLVIDKPAGLVVHPAPGHSEDTLVNALIARNPELRIGEALRPGIVHRLDKDTSGLMVVAKNDRAMASLTQQLKDRQVLKEYLALVEGHLPTPTGVIEALVGRHPHERKRMAVVPGGRAARTHFVVLEVIGNQSLVRIRLETGRTHQIRVHFAAIGHPVACDPVYGSRHCPCPALHRQFLHAERLGFRLPSTGEYVAFESKLPEDLTACLATLLE